MGSHLIHFIQFGVVVEVLFYFNQPLIDGFVGFLIAFSQNIIEIEMIKQSKRIFTHNQQPNVGDSIYCCTDSGTSSADMLEWLPGRSFPLPFSLSPRLFFTATAVSKVRRSSRQPQKVHRFHHKNRIWLNCIHFYLICVLTAQLFKSKHQSFMDVLLLTSGEWPLNYRRGCAKHGMI